MLLTHSGSESRELDPEPEANIPFKASPHDQLLSLRPQAQVLQVVPTSATSCVPGVQTQILSWTLRVNHGTFRSLRYSV